MGVGLVSEQCGLRTEHPHRGEREQGSAACGSVRGGALRSGGGGTAEVHGWHALESCGLLLEAAG